MLAIQEMVSSCSRVHCYSVVNKVSCHAGKMIGVQRYSFFPPSHKVLIG